MLEIDLKFGGNVLEIHSHGVLLFAYGDQPHQMLKPQTF